MKSTRIVQFAVLTVWGSLFGLVLPQDEASPLTSPQTYRGLELRAIGPALMSGRIADIAIDPLEQNTWYVAAGSGGLWKTTNGGTTWKAIFEDEGSYSIGCVAVDPLNPRVVWVGTGENVSGRHVGFGDGVYRSLNGGETWSRMGLESSEHIGKILIDRRDSNTLFVAAEGPLWSSGGARGVYRSKDGGKSWQAVLQISEDTGVTDLEFDPSNPDRLYAAAYQRRRHVWAFLAGGPESAIYKSEDGGDSWRTVTKGLPKGDKGRIGLAVSPLRPNVVYATIEASEEERGFYRSEDRGESWEKRNSYVSSGTGPHYYQEIYASPHEFDRVYQMDVYLHVTEDGGKNFERLGEERKHVDNHALAFDPKDPEYLLAGCDGGLYESYDHGKNWRYVSNLPLTQFYKMALDNDFPFYNVVGGTQDNNTQLGPTQTGTVNGIRNQDWIVTVGGDGYSCQIDPENPDIVYSESQYGNLYRFDKSTGERLGIKPHPRPGDPSERWNWDSPILISPHSNQRLYFASQRLWRSDDRGDSWTPVSGDLTLNQNRYELPFFDRVWSVDALYDNGAMSWYNTITTIAESPLQEGLLYVGTDDGILQVSEDGGGSWRRVDQLPGVAPSFFVNDLRASHHDPDVVFAAVDQHKIGDLTPYLLRSDDRGRSWNSIRGDLPDRHIVWSIAQDHVQPDLLFAATEYGLFFTLNGGLNWTRLEGNVPTIAFRDLEIQQRENDLVGASFGRGFYVLDDYSPLRQIETGVLAEEAHLFDIADALLYLPASPLGGSGGADQGAGYFVAENPPFGAISTYHLAESLKSKEQLRQEREGEIRTEGGDIPFPGWDQLRQEAREQAPSLSFVIRDEAGQFIRRLEGPAEKGFQRVAWDLRYPSPSPRTERARSRWNTSEGPLVAPGRYTVSVMKIVEGSEVETGQSRSFEVKALGEGTLARATAAERVSFQQDLAELSRQVEGAGEAIDFAQERLELMRQAALAAPGGGEALLGRLDGVRLRLLDLEEQLAGDSIRSRWDEPREESISSRLSMLERQQARSSYGPTPAHRENLEFARAAYSEIAAGLRTIIDEELVSLESALDEGRAPWTPGRSVPVPR